MKTRMLYLWIAAICLSCKSDPKNEQLDTITESQKPISSTTVVEEPVADNSKTSIDWDGTYRGTLPCADCSGLETQIVLNANGNFSRQLKYLGTSDTLFTDHGQFKWDDSGSFVTLNLSDGGSQSYKVGENRIWHLGENNAVITGDLADNYILNKVMKNAELEDKNWQLIELMGQAIDPEKIKASMLFSSADAMVSGSDSCNNYSGSYELLPGQRFKLDSVRSTLRACLDMNTANKFNAVLKRADNYTINDGVLSITKSRMAPMARFQLIPEDN